MLCPKCGKEISNRANFCNYCGREVHYCFIRRDDPYFEGEYSEFKLIKLIKQLEKDGWRYIGDISTSGRKTGNSGFFWHKDPKAEIISLLERKKKKTKKEKKMIMIEGKCELCSRQGKVYLIYTESAIKHFCHKCAIKHFAQYCDIPEKFELLKLIVEFGKEPFARLDFLNQKYPELSFLFYKNREILKNYLLHAVEQRLEADGIIKE